MATQDLGILVVIFGCLLFIGAAVVSYYQVPIGSVTVGGKTVQVGSYEPYANDALPLFFGGLALFVLGFALILYEPQQQNLGFNAQYQQRPSQRIMHCYYCGAENPYGITFCGNCGKRLNQPPNPPPPTDQQWKLS